MAGELKVTKQSKLSALRRGVPMHKNVTLGVGDNTVEVKVVLLSSDDMLDIEESTEEYCKSIGDRNNRVVRNNYYNKLLASMCMRDPSDSTLQTQIAESVDEVGEFLDIEDIDRVCNAYRELLTNKAPRMDIMTNDELEELKNYLRVTPLKDLSTVLLTHLKSCHQTLVSEK